MVGKQAIDSTDLAYTRIKADPGLLAEVVEALRVSDLIIEKLGGNVSQKEDARAVVLEAKFRSINGKLLNDLLFHQ